jgi:hypothetical protein
MRVPLSKKVRFDVFKRDGFRCSYCGATPSETVLLEVDHVHPVAEGGTNDMDNLVTACFDCNRGKRAELLSVIPQSIEDKAAQTAEREAQIRAFYEILEAKKQRKEDELWSVAEIFMEKFHDDSIHKTRLASIRSFLDRLNVYEVQEAMEMASDKMPWSRERAFRYFCGICWNKIKRANGEDV